MPDLLALVVLVVVIAAVAGAVRLAGGDGTGPIVLGAGVAVVLLAVLAAVGLAVGGAGDSGDDDPDDAGVPTVSQRTPAHGPTPLQPPAIELVATDPDRLPPVPRAVGELVPGATLVVGVSGLEAGSAATVHQCPTGAVEAADCRAGLPFTVSDAERATVLVDVQDRFGVGRRKEDVVRCSGTACSIVVFGTSRLEVVTVFGEPAPPAARLAASPRALPPGASLTATADRLPPGADAAFVVCRPGGEADADCGPPTPSTRVGADGRASAEVTVSPGRCARGETCAVAVVVGDGGPRAFAHLQITGRSGADYDDGRIALGIAIAGLLLAVAIALLVITDWTPVGGDPFAGVEVPRDPFAGLGDD